MPLALQDAALMAIAVPAALVDLTPHSYRTTLALLASAVAFASMIVPPVAGALSDRIRKAGGSRVPMVVIGSILNIAALVALAYARIPWLFASCVVAAALFENVAVAAYQALLPDIVPRASWGTASGVRGVSTLIGTVIGLAVAGVFTPGTTFLIAGGIAAILSLTLFMIHETGAHVEEPRAHVVDRHDFIVVFIGRCWIVLGLSLLMTYILYFFRDVLHVTNASAGTGLVAGAALVGAMVSSIWLGIASDRVSRKLVVALSGVPMVVAAVGFALFPRENMMLFLAIFFGIGYGGILSSGWALAIDTIPQMHDAARDLGIWGIASNLPAVVAPLLGAWVLSVFGGSLLGYQVLFAVAGGAFALGSLTVLAVRKRQQVA